MRSAVTVSLVPEARGGPFVFWDDLEAAARTAADLGFDALEVFPPGPEAFDPAAVRALLSRYGLALAAVGTGAGWVRHKLTLTAADPAARARALAFVRGIIDVAGACGAPAIIGSMQGRWGGAGGDGTGPAVRDAALALLADALTDLGDHARRHGVPLLYEPLNRYETNLANTLADGAALIGRAGCDNVKLLADLFHMNVEEADLPAALVAAGPRVGHVHLADSNRRPAGCGHTAFAPIAAALRQIGCAGYVSAEALPYPGPAAAAKQTIEVYRTFFASR